MRWFLMSSCHVTLIVLYRIYGPWKQFESCCTSMYCSQNIDEYIFVISSILSWLSTMYAAIWHFFSGDIQVDMSACMVVVMITVVIAQLLNV